MRSKGTLGIVLGIGALMVGCGGSSGTSSTPTSSESPPMTKAAFIERADAICQKVRDAYTVKVAALEKKNKKQGRPTPRTEKNLKAAVPPLYVASAELEDLSPPKGDEKEIKAIIDKMGEVAKEIEAKPTSLLYPTQPPFIAFHELTEPYGLKVCAEL